MNDAIIRLFIKESDRTDDSDVREAYGILAGSVGIISNIVLSAAKFFVGVLSGSIAIQADAVNNLSDVGASVVTLIGSKAASKPADRQHPYGHARIEYIAGLAIAFLILLVGFELGKESIKKIISPTPVDFGIWSIVVLTLSIGMKLWMGTFTANIGRRIHSATMSAATADSMADVISTVAILASGLISYFTHINIDGWIGAVVACFVLYSGFRIAKETVSPLMGEAPSAEFVKEISSRIMGYDGIIGVHDIMVHSYGPGRTMASAHAEVRADSDILAIHETIDEAERQIGGAMNMLLTIHLDPIETDNEVLNRAKADIAEVIAKIDGRVRFHDLRMLTGRAKTNLIFDIMVPPEMKSDEIARIKDAIQEGALEKDPEYNCVIEVDLDYCGEG